MNPVVQWSLLLLVAALTYIGLLAFLQQKSIEHDREPWSDFERAAKRRRDARSLEATSYYLLLFIVMVFVAFVVSPALRKEMIPPNRCPAPGLRGR